MFFIVTSIIISGILITLIFMNVAFSWWLPLGAAVFYFLGGFSAYILDIIKENKEN